MHGAALAFLQQFQCDGGTGFGVGEGVELVVGKAATEVAAGSRQDAIFYLVPDVREERSVICVIRPQPVDLLAEPGVVVRIRMDEAVEGVHHFPIAKKQR